MESNHSPDLTLVIPFYNNIEILLSCHKGLIDFVALVNWIEIILVDDGSDEHDLVGRSYEIVRDHCSGSSRITMIRQANNKQGSARNFGLAHARGRYIWYVDSDDYVCIEQLVNLHRLLTEHKPIILFHSLPASFFKQFPDMLPNYSFIVGQDHEASHIYDCISSKLPLAPWSYILDAEIAKYLRFPEGVYFEDLPYFIDVVSLVDRNIAYTSLELYSYDISLPSTTRSSRTLIKSIIYGYYSLRMGIAALLKVTFRCRAMPFGIRILLSREILVRHTIYYTILRLLGR
jgi:glycosyltransferase involved in cell wall biosynthesis